MTISVIALNFVFSKQLQHHIFHTPEVTNFIKCH